MKRINSKLFFVVFFAIFSLFNIFCDNSVIHNPINTDKLPMWPELGYNGRRTGDLVSSNSSILPVNGTIVQWSDTLVGKNVIQSTIDSKGNLYYLLVHEDYISCTLYKIDAYGKIKWTYKNNAIIPSFGNGIGISADDKNIYIPAFTGLFCVDSSGILNWNCKTTSIYSNLTMPAIDRDGTIYSVIGNYQLASFTSNGSLKWMLPGAMGAPSIDNEGNIYIGMTDGVIGGNNNGIAKIDKNGVLKWKYDLIVTPLGIVIDANNNIYFQNANHLNTGLYSFNKDGKLRWSILQHLGDSLSFSIFNTPIINSKNELYVSGGWFINETIISNGIFKLDTLGKILNRTSIEIGGWNPITEFFFDKDENIYFHNDSKYGSIDKNFNSRFLENSAIKNIYANIFSNCIIIKYDNNVIISSIK